MCVVRKNEKETMLTTIRWADDMVCVRTVNESTGSLQAECYYNSLSDARHDAFLVIGGHVVDFTVK